jgi:hypothetical protein
VQQLNSVSGFWNVLHDFVTYWKPREVQICELKEFSTAEELFQMQIHDLVLVFFIFELFFHQEILRKRFRSVQKLIIFEVLQLKSGSSVKLPQQLLPYFQSARNMKYFRISLKLLNTKRFQLKVSEIVRV